MNKVLVTGGAGFIGSHLVDRLVEEGYKVIVADDLSRGRLENVNTKADFEKIDITSNRFSILIKKIKPDKSRIIISFGLFIVTFHLNKLI